MALVVNTNVPSIASQRYLMESRKEMETAMERLSSGKRINSAADDAAGLAISERMSTQITGLNMAIRNANDGISLTQTAEGAMQEVNDMLQRMRELALQAVHGVNNSADRESLDLEVQALKAEIDRVAGSTTFNNMNILDGSYSASFQIGYNVGETLEMALASVDTASLGLNVGGSESNPASGTNVLISNRLTETFKFDADLDGAYTTTASVGIYSLGSSAGEIDAAGSSFAAGDVVINGQELGAFDGTALASANGHDIYDLVQNINSNVDNVLASSFNTVVAKTVGDGVVAENELAIKVGSIGKSGDAHYQSETYVALAASNSLEEMVENINRAFTNDEVVASINSDGKLVLSNDTGAAIYIADTTGTSGAYDGATGFEVSSGTVTATSASGYKGFQGFLKLQSTDGSAIEIEAGNSELASPGTISDLKAIGFTEITEDPTGSSYTVVGSALTSAQIQDSLGKDSTTGKADLVINGIDIYDDTLTATSNTFQGKLDMINAFTDQTNVVASAIYERVFDTSNMTFVDNNTITVNGKTVDTGTSLSELVSNINGSLADANNPSSGAVTQSTGITASYEGNNLILRGDNVQNVNIVNNDYEITSEAEATLPAYVSAGTARSMTWLAADVKAGRTLTISVSGATLSSLGGASSYSYTVVDGDTVSTVADKFYDLIVEDMLAQTSASEAFTVAQHISVTGATISFQSGASAGSATITMGVTQVGAANLMFSASNVDHYGAMKLQSTDGSPIAIDFGDSAREDGELGLVEMNVGDSTYDVNDPTSTVDQITVAAVSGISVATSDAAEAALAALDAALETVTQNRADLGAVQNRLNHTVSNLANVVENTSASQSRILDADFAVEAAALARAQILQQAGTAMLAQANAAPQNVLSLLG